MGLDQYFHMTPNDYEQDNQPIAYYRKNHLLHTFIEEVVGFDIECAECVRLSPSQTERVVKFLCSALHQDTMRYENVETYMVEPIGMLTYTYNTGQDIFYCADW